MEIVNIIILEATDMLCNYNTEKLLGLKGVIVKNVRQLPDRTEIFIELPKEPHVCPCCGHKTSHVHEPRSSLSSAVFPHDKPFSRAASIFGSTPTFDKEPKWERAVQLLRPTASGQISPLSSRAAPQMIRFPNPT